MVAVAVVEFVVVVVVGAAGIRWTTPRSVRPNNLSNTDAIPRT